MRSVEETRIDVLNERRFMAGSLNWFDLVCTVVGQCSTMRMNTA